MKKVVVITGGSDGLGKSIAKTLSPMYNVVVLGRNEERLKVVSRTYSCKGVVCDISDPTAICNTVRKIIEDMGRIDVLINCAGVYLKGQVDKNEIQDIQKLIAVNTTGPILLIREILPFMKKKKKGTIINIISKDGLYSKPDRSVYGASKWGLTGFTKYLQHDLPKYNIRIMGIYPGRIATRLINKKYPKEKIDMNDRVDPSEIAKTIEFILSQKDTTLYSTIGIKHIKN